jgi:hypothetical protein
VKAGTTDTTFYLARAASQGTQAAADMQAIARGCDKYGPYNASELDYIARTAYICARLAFQYAELAGQVTRCDARQVSQ